MDIVPQVAGMEYVHIQKAAPVAAPTVECAILFVGMAIVMGQRPVQLV